MADPVVAPLRRWIGEPSSWLALAASAISIATFVLVYANPGKLKVFLPDRVGVQIAPGGQVSLLLPLTFTNTGAPRRWRHVVRVGATLTPEPRGNHTPQTVAWWQEQRFVDWREWKKKNPDEEQGAEDYVEYVNRALPFSLAGSTSQSKVFLMRQEGQIKSELDGPPTWKEFSLYVFAVQEKGRAAAEQRYVCEQVVAGDLFQWCVMVPTDRRLR